MGRSLGLLCGEVCFLRVISATGWMKGDETAILRSGSEEAAKDAGLIFLAGAKAKRRRFLPSGSEERAMTAGKGFHVRGARF